MKRRTIFIALLLVPQTMAANPLGLQMHTLLNKKDKTILLESSNTGSASLIAIGTNSAGVRTVSWLQDESGSTSLFAATATSSGTWTTNQTVGAPVTWSSHSNWPQAPKIVVSSTGIPTIVYRNMDLYITQRVAGSWSVPAVVATGYDSGSGVFLDDLAIDSSNNVRAMFARHDGTRFRRYIQELSSATSTWGTMTRVDGVNRDMCSIEKGKTIHDGSAWFAVFSGSTTANDTCYPFIDRAIGGTDTQIGTNYSTDMDISGYSSKVGAVFTQRVSSQLDIYATFYNGTSWSAAVALENSNVTNSELPQIEVDTSGNALVTYSRNNASTYDLIWHRRPFATGTWSAAATLNTGAGSVSNVALRMRGSTGDAVAAWRQGSDGYYSTYSAASGTWSAPALFETESGAIEAIDAAIDDTGRVTIVWTQQVGTYFNAYAREF